MSDYIPFELQSEIIKSLPVKSIIQFRSVSKRWKSLIDSPEFIKKYHLNHPNPQHHLLVKYELHNVPTYTSIADNNTFPHQKFLLTAPESLSLLRDTLKLLGSADGLLCFYGVLDSKTRMAILWNPTLRKSVSIVIPSPKLGYDVVGLGVCPDTGVPKLLKINVDKTSSMWGVEIFTLSTRVWKTVFMGAPFKSRDLICCEAFVNGVFYFRAHDFCLNDGVGSNIIISFDLKSEMFGEVCLPERLVHTHDLEVTKVNESLGLLEYYAEGEIMVCGVWKMSDDDKTFSKTYSVKVEGKSWFVRVLDFRNNGEVVIQVDDDNFEKSRIKVYEPLSGHICDAGINVDLCTFSARSYMQTLLLLDQSDAIH